LLEPKDQAAVAAQINREPRGVIGVGHRCGCGAPDVVKTAPRLDDGTPFPTLYYLTCPRAAAYIGTLEANGVMKQLEDELKVDPKLAEHYQNAHQLYLAQREEIEKVEEIAGITAGGMPNRVKCLHVLVAHSLAAGPGVNPLGDKTLAMLKDWSIPGPCWTENFEVEVIGE
jgi:hypothetical protein